jgi:hypothetical protein
MRLLMLVTLLAALTAAGAAWAHGQQDGRNFNAVLQPAPGTPQDGSGMVKFRQAEDEDWIAYLHVRLQDLLPHHSYYLERATDEPADDDCTGSNWLKLGQLSLGPVPIGTDETGNGPALLFRDLSALQGRHFDIHFRVKDATTDATVLVSDCYQFTVLQ